MDSVVDGGGDKLMTPAEVAGLMRVEPKTVTRWAKPDRKGNIRLRSLRTPGGHHRFWESDVRLLLQSRLEIPRQR